MARLSIETWFVLVFSLLFILANSVLTLHYVNLLNAVPVMLLVGLLLAFWPDRVFIALVLLAPLSVKFSRFVPDLPFDFWFPTEPVLVTLLSFVILISLQRRYFQKELFNHPVFWALVLYLLWILIAVIPSEMVLVSIKSFLLRFWYIGVFFYLAYVLFRRDMRNINRFLWAYTIGMGVVSCITLYKHATRGLFCKFVAHQACAPFFTDHTSYGAALAFVIPIVVMFALTHPRVWVRRLSWGLSAYFLVAMVFSYSRAAWISIFMGGVVWGLVLLRLRFRTLVVTGVAVIALFLTFSRQILDYMDRNTTDSSGNLAEHVHSILNIRTDESNRERINRWAAALDMFEQRPLFGWGPATFMFQYAPFQRSYLKTSISTNFGTGGNAHSEYLGHMSESGLPSAILFLLIYILIFWRGFSILRHIPNRQHRGIVTACLVGLVTYFLHGFLNNFLDTDKIAAPFFGFIAIIMAVEFYYFANKNQPTLGSSADPPATPIGR